MGFKEYLQGLAWNSFNRYPTQGADIYIHCHTEYGHHKFYRIRQFNAVSFSFDFTKVMKDNSDALCWQYSWLPAEQVEKDYDNRTSN